jgi:hypothetical protein
MSHRPSVQPSRRAVLHAQAPGDPAVAPDLAAWYTERAFHFYSAPIRLPRLAPVGARPRARYLAAAFADLDDARARLRGADGMASIIVTGQGRGAIVAALWQDARRSAAADALILHGPALPPGVSLSLDVGCPVLVLAGPDGPDASPPGRRQPGRRSGWRARYDPPADRGVLQPGGHVTWLRMPGADLSPEAGARPRYFDELGRWLGAYMYGSLRDQLL